MRREVWVVLALSLAAAVAAATTAASPEEEETTEVVGASADRCAYEAGDEDEYRCPLSDGGTLTIRTQPNSYVKIDCDGGTLRCADVPRLRLARDGRLASAAVRACALRAALPCALAALGARSVATLSLWALRGPLLPRHVRGFDDLTALMMFDSGVERAVPVAALAALPALRHFRLRDARLQLGPLPALPLRYLELSLDRLPALPAAAFRRLPLLEQLHLWGNDYTALDMHTFEGLSSLNTLSLSASLQNISAGTFAPTPELKELTLMRGNLARLREGVFTGLQHLEKVTMSNDKNLTVEPRAFAALPSLTALKLDMCTIHELPPDAFSGSSALVNLSLVANQLQALPADLLRDQIALQRLYLEKNKIKALPADLFAATKKLIELNLDNNLIEELSGELFSGLSDLTTVSMSHNRLKAIAGDVFQGARSLRTLQLSNNQLTLLPSAALPAVFQYDNIIITQSPFSWLLELRQLDLSHNRVSFMFDDWTTTLLQLKNLDLSYNHFSRISSMDLPFLSSNIVVDLRHNNISTVYLHEQLSPGPPPASRAGGASVASVASVALLADNPLRCDCQLYGVVQRMRGHYNEFRTEIKLDFGDAACVAPEHLAATRISALQPDELTCHFTDECPRGCRCAFRSATDTSELLCNTTDFEPPKPTNFNVKRTQLQLSFVPPALSAVPEVQILKLNGLNMTRLPPGLPPPSVASLDLRNNSLADVPAELVEVGVELSLAGNPLECDCWHAAGLALLERRRSGVEDYEDVTCADGLAVAALDVARLCAHVTAAAAGGALALGGVLVGLAAALAYRYSLEVRVWLFARGLCLCLLPEERLDGGKRYDAFLSFAHGDEKFVTSELLPRLDAEYRVCVHYRDWAVGELIPLQVARSVESSRRTIIVLSPHFLQSVWARLEFRAAHAAALRERRARVLVVLLRDVAGHAALDAELRAYLATNTYVRWGDPRFWDKLRYVLPRRPHRPHHPHHPLDRQPRGLDVHLDQDGKLVNAAIKA